MSEVRWLSTDIAARRAVYDRKYFVRVFCFTGEGPRPFIIREFPTPGGRRRIQVHEASFMTWLASLERQ